LLKNSQERGAAEVLAIDNSESNYPKILQADVALAICMAATDKKAD